MTATDGPLARHRAPLAYGVATLTCIGLAAAAVMSGEPRLASAAIVLAVTVPTSIAFTTLIRAHARSRQDSQAILGALVDMRAKQSRKEFQIRTEIAEVSSQISDLRDRIRTLEGITHTRSTERTNAEAKIARQLNEVRARLDSFGEEESGSESEHAALNELLLSLMLNQDTIVRSLEARSGSETRRATP